MSRAQVVHKLIGSFAVLVLALSDHMVSLKMLAWGLQFNDGWKIYEVKSDDWYH